MSLSKFIEKDGCDFELLDLSSSELNKISQIYVIKRVLEKQWRS